MSRHRALSSSQLVERSAELPEVVLKEGGNWTSITFRGKGFAWVDHPENRAMIKAHHDERDALLATAPGVYEPGWTTNSSAWVRVRLERADPDEVLELLEEAWRMTATKRAIRAFDESRRAGRQGDAAASDGTPAVASPPPICECRGHEDRPGE